MSDRFSAEIRIGGKVSRTEELYPRERDDDTTILQGLIGALNEDGGSHEYGDITIDPHQCDWDNLAKYLDNESLLNLKNDQAVNGEFTETEQFCMEHGIAFDRWSDHYCEYDAENAYWRPGMDNKVVRFADSRGDEIIAADPVRAALALLTENQKTPADPDKAIQRVIDIIHEAARLLRDACPELPPNLETFEVIS